MADITTVNIVPLGQCCTGSYTLPFFSAPAIAIFANVMPSRREWAGHGRPMAQRRQAAWPMVEGTAKNLTNSGKIKI